MKTARATRSAAGRRIRCAGRGDRRREPREGTAEPGQTLGGRRPAETEPSPDPGSRRAPVLRALRQRSEWHSGTDPCSRPRTRTRRRGKASRSRIRREWTESASRSTRRRWPRRTGRGRRGRAPWPGRSGPMRSDADWAGTLVGGVSTGHAQRSSLCSPPQPCGHWRPDEPTSRPFTVPRPAGKSKTRASQRTETIVARSREVRRRGRRVHRAWERRLLTDRRWGVSRRRDTRARLGWTRTKRPAQLLRRIGVCSCRFGGLPLSSGTGQRAKTLGWSRSDGWHGGCT